jgi:tagatose 1,6-diphosphate aldolase
MKDPTFPFLNPGPLSDGELELHINTLVPADESQNIVPTYRFDMRLGDRVIGGIRFRAATSLEIELYAGNLGYNVDPPYRGRRFAERACRLVLPLARAHGFGTLWITCDPGNLASRKTCERLGAVLVEIIALPEHIDMFRDGEREKCRYRLALATTQYT